MQEAVGAGPRHLSPVITFEAGINREHGRAARAYSHGRGGGRSPSWVAQEWGLQEDTPSACNLKSERRGRGRESRMRAGLLRAAHRSKSRPTRLIRGRQRICKAETDTHPIGEHARRTTRRTACIRPWRTLARTTWTSGTDRASGKTILTRPTNGPLDFRGRIRVDWLLAAAFRPSRFPLDGDLRIRIRAVERRLRRGRGTQLHDALVVLELSGVGDVLGVGVLLLGGALAHRLRRQGAGETVHGIRVGHRKESFCLAVLTCCTTSRKSANIVLSTVGSSWMRRRNMEFSSPKRGYLGEGALSWNLEVNIAGELMERKTAISCLVSSYLSGIHPDQSGYLCSK